MPIAYCQARSKQSKMPEPNSRARFGGRCRRLPRWCRELKSGSIFCDRGAGAGGLMNLWSRKKSCLFEELTADSSQLRFKCSRFIGVLLVSSASLQLRSQNLLLCFLLCFFSFCCYFLIGCSRFRLCFHC